MSERPIESDPAETKGESFLDPTEKRPTSSPPTELAEAGDMPTLGAPSLPAALPSTPLPVPVAGRLAQGEIIGDFELLTMLGKGAAGTVFLARELSLGRLVALKVSADVGEEARTLASLMHPRIVQVYSETVDSAAGRRLLCMQYIAGPTLAGLLADLCDVPFGERHGRRLLEAIDRLSPGPAELDAEGLRRREALNGDDAMEACCRLGEELAGALAYAHAQGVLHRDIKPANILIDRYGRPYLADFGLASRSTGEAETFGGTPAYMAPEHLDALATGERGIRESVNEQCDVYSLGAVLFTWLAGHSPHWHPRAAKSGKVALAELAERRRRPASELWPGLSHVPASLAFVVARCLEPSPADRFDGAAELSAALADARRMMEARHRMPPAGRLTRLISAHPFFTGVSFTFWPHVAGSVVCPAYLVLMLRDRLALGQVWLIASLAIAFGFVIFPLMALWVLLRFRPTFVAIAGLRKGRRIGDAAVRHARRRVLTAPWTSVFMSCVAWLAILAIAPLSCALWGYPMDVAMFLHFLASIFYGVIIATSYSFLVLQYCLVRSWYLQLWMDPGGFTAEAARDTQGAAASARLFVFLASLVPLFAAVLLILVGPDGVEGGSSLAFRIFSVGLILLGAAGFFGSLRLLTRIEGCVRVFAGSLPGHEPPGSTKLDSVSSSVNPRIPARSGSE